MESIVEVRNLHHRYEDGTEALQGIDLKVARGEKLAIMGPNGSGKSTLFLHLNGILRPTEGKVFVTGKELEYKRKDLLEVRKKVGIVFQNPDDQLFSASVRQEISFGILNLGVSQLEAQQKVNQVIAELNIEPFADKPTHFLSGGEKKRVSIADVLVMDPEVILFDEPAAALDPKHARLIDEMIDQLSDKGITVILSTHDVERALIWADRLIVFDHGKIVGDGKPEDILCNEELLAKTNLEKPTVLKIFHTLCQADILDSTLKMPHKVQELEGYINQRKGV